MKILFVAAEVAPLVKVGGLADVVGSLPLALRELGHDVRVVIPSYGAIDRSKLSLRSGPSFTSQVEGHPQTITVSQTMVPQSDVPLYLIDFPPLFQDNGVYPVGQAVEIQRLGLQRFVMFSSFVAQWLAVSDWQPEVVHCHDWHAGLVPIALAIHHQPVHTILTIHNLHNQGVWNAAEVWSWLGWRGDEHPLLAELDQHNDLNILQLAIHSASIVNTVSPTYAQEIVTAPYGEGLADDLATHRPPLVGILNGLDQVAYDPSRDQHLAEQYTIKTVMTGKATNKSAVQQKLNLEPAAAAPLFVAISRLSPQKGFDLFPPVIDDIVRAGGQVAILGSGWPEIEGELHRLADDHPRAVAIHLGFDAALAQQLYAAADFFLMPSRFEPCGLGQMIAMRYGSVPIVRDTGGLHDTVTDLRHDPDQGTGFVFPRFDAGDFRQAIQAAVQLYRRPATLATVIGRDMRHDFSWARSAHDYMKLYAQAENA